MKSKFTFLIFPALTVFIISPLLIVVHYIYFNEKDISGFGGYWGIPLVVFFWATPIYLLVFSLAQAVDKKFRRMAQGLIVLALSFVGIIAAVFAALSCVGGCADTLMNGYIGIGLLICYDLFLYWLTHKPTWVFKQASKPEL